MPKWTSDQLLAVESEGNLLAGGEADAEVDE